MGYTKLQRAHRRFMKKELKNKGGNMKKAARKWMKSPERKKAIRKKHSRKAIRKKHSRKAIRKKHSRKAIRKKHSRNKFRVEANESAKQKLQKALENLKKSNPEQARRIYKLVKNGDISFSRATEAANNKIAPSAG